MQWGWEHQAMQNSGYPCVYDLRIHAKEGHIRWRHHSLHVRTKSFWAFLVIWCRELLSLWQMWHVVTVQTYLAMDCEKLPQYPQCQVSGIVNPMMFLQGILSNRSCGSCSCQGQSDPTCRCRGNSRNIHLLVIKYDCKCESWKYTYCPRLNELLEHATVIWFYHKQL